MHESGDLMFCSTGNQIAAYDLRRLHVPAFSSQGVPEEIDTFVLDGGDVVSMRMHPTVPSELICMVPERSQHSTFGDIFILDTVRHETTSFKTKSPRVDDPTSSRLEMFGEDRLVTAFESNLRIQDLRHYGWRGDPRQTHHRDITFSSKVTSFAVNPNSENYVVVGIWDDGTHSSDLKVLGLGDGDDDAVNGGDDTKNTNDGDNDDSGNNFAEIVEIDTHVPQFKGSSYPRDSWCRYGIP